MEQKKTLWIIAAVGAFLLVVLGTAGMLYSPTRSRTPAIASVAPVEKSGQPSSTGWTSQVDVQPPVPVPGDASVPVPRVNDMIVLADNTTVYNLNKKDDGASATMIDLNALKNELIADAQTSSASQPQNINITVNMNDRAEPADGTEKATAPAAVVKSDVSSAGSVAVAAAPSTTKTSVQTASKTSGAAEPKPVQKSAVNVTVKSGNSTVTASSSPKEEPKKMQFWVQVAAYSNKKGAENARTVLDSNKIPADVFTYKDNKDRLFYRVRVGPYTTKSEAEYWRTRIVKIDEFVKAESFVTSTVTN